MEFLWEQTPLCETGVAKKLIFHTKKKDREKSKQKNWKEISPDKDRPNYQNFLIKSKITVLLLLCRLPAGWESFVVII
jgi:hypothetical protein